MKEFASVLRQPDDVKGGTERTAFRFEERKEPCPVPYEYRVEGGSAKVFVAPTSDPVRYLKLRFRGDFQGADGVYGDYWARSSYVHPLEWKRVLPERVMPWFCYVQRGKKVHCYGVKTGADCFASWLIDPKGITLFLDLSNGNGGTALAEPLLACEVVEIEKTTKDVFLLAEEFSSMLCEKPVLPKQPVFGINNWYWAYGDISAKSVLAETDYLMQMTEGCKNRPYMIIDDGWQKHRVAGDDVYIGGEWAPNERFGDMQALCEQIHAKGAKAGLWFRPLLTREEMPDECVLAEEFGGKVLDPSHPAVLEKVKGDAARIRGWGFELIKHDFTQIDMFGNYADNPDVAAGRNFYDKTKTNATIIKNLYKAIQEGAGEADVIGCNVFGHLSAGIHSVHRTGGDTSGRVFEVTRSDGVNTMMRLPTNERFYLVDPDCAAFTEKVPVAQNLDFLEMCALCGVTTLASVPPDSLSAETLARIKEIFRVADEGSCRYTVVDYEKTCCPDTFRARDKKQEKHFDWYAGYDGVRVKFDWVE